MRRAVVSVAAALSAVLVAAAMSACSPAKVTASGTGFDDCRQNFYQGFVPHLTDSQPGQQRALCFSDFAVLHSGQSKTPLYAAEHLTPESLADARGEKRTNQFYEEARLPAAERSRLADYRGSDFDRGHLAAAAQRTTPEAMAQSFSLANMVPEAPKHNRGVWAKSVEKATRSYVARGNEAYVLTGPLFRGGPATIGAGRVWVPSAMFKLVYDPAKKRAWAYVVDNKDDAQVTGTVSYGELVRLTGVDWLPSGAVSR